MWSNDTKYSHHVLANLQTFLTKPEVTVLDYREISWDYMFIL